MVSEWRRPRGGEDFGVIRSWSGGIQLWVKNVFVMEGNSENTGCGGGFEIDYKSFIIFGEKIFYDTILDFKRKCEKVTTFVSSFNEIIALVLRMRTSISDAAR